MDLFTKSKKPKWKTIPIGENYFAKQDTKTDHDV